jgi:hypothetical protein
VEKRCFARGVIATSPNSSAQALPAMPSTRGNGRFRIGPNTDRPMRRAHARQMEDRMKWITREHVKVDRVACPWLIKKFVDQDAEFIFVPADKVGRRG